MDEKQEGELVRDRQFGEGMTSLGTGVNQGIKSCNASFSLLLLTSVILFCSYRSVPHHFYFPLPFLSFLFTLRFLLLQR